MMRPGSYQIKVVYVEDVPSANLSERIIHKGIVDLVGQAILQDPDDHERLGDMLLPGNIVYYRDGTRVGECVFIEPTDIISYERTSE